MLLREDPLANQRFREATAQYLADPAGGGKVIRDQIIDKQNYAKPQQILRYLRFNRRIR